MALANPQLKDNRGKTAADIAREQNFAETAQLLDRARTSGLKRVMNCV